MVSEGSTSRVMVLPVKVFTKICILKKFCGSDPNYKPIQNNNLLKKKEETETFLHGQKQMEQVSGRS